MTDAEVRGLADPAMAAEAISGAFGEAARGEVAPMARHRIAVSGLKHLGDVGDPALPGCRRSKGL
jgi:hypothetical protein